MKSNWLRELLLLSFCFACCIGAFAQADTTTEVGLYPHGGYHGGEIDKIDLMSGNLNLTIPLFSLPQKGGLSLSMSAAMNNPQYVATQACDSIEIIGQDPGGNSDIDYETYCSQYYYPASGGQGVVITLDQAVTPSALDSTIYISPNYSLDLHTNQLVDSSGATHNLGWDSENPSILRASDGSGYSELYVPNTTGPAYLSGSIISSPLGLSITNSWTTGLMLAKPLMFPCRRFPIHIRTQSRLQIPI